MKNLDTVETNPILGILAATFSTLLDVDSRYATA